MEMSRMEYLISDMLRNMGAPHAKGFTHIVSSIALVYSDPSRMDALMKEVLGQIANCESGGASIEKCMRDFIKKWWPNLEKTGLFYERPSVKLCVSVLAEYFHKVERTRAEESPSIMEYLWG